MNPQDEPQPVSTTALSKPDLYRKDSLRNFRAPRHKVLMAAKMVAEGVHSNQDIAEVVGISVQAFWSWRTKRAFTDVVAAYRKRFDAITLNEDVASKAGRIAAHVRTFRRIEKVIEARAADPETMRTPGGNTGLLSHDIKSVGGGLAAQVVDVYEFDAALIKARTEALENIAKEQGGQYEDKPQGPQVTDNRKVIFNFPVATPELLAEVANARTIDLPAARPRLLTRPSDGAQR